MGEVGGFKGLQLQETETQTQCGCKVNKPHHRKHLAWNQAY